MENGSVAVLKIKGVLFVSLPADPDDVVISNLQVQVLEMMQRENPVGLIMDLTLIDTLDSFFARTIVETGRMVALMGGRTVLAGIGPQVAITVTQLGIALRSIPTALGVDRAFDILLADSSVGSGG